MTNPLGTGGYEPRTTPAERRDFFDLRRKLVDRMKWAGDWDINNNPYDYGDTVLDDGWTMICAEPMGCSQRPSPQPTGNQFYLYEGLDPVTSDTQAQIIFGNRYTITQDGYVDGYRVWTEGGNFYSVYSIRDPDGSNELSQLISFAGRGGWETFGLTPQLVLAGTVFEVIAIVQEPDPTPTIWYGEWNYTTPQNPGAPALGEIIHANSLPASFRINKTDFNGGPRGAELLLLEVGDRIQGPNILWGIQAVTDAGTYVDIQVAPATQDSPDGVFNFEFETVEATPMTYLEDVDYWLGSPYNVQGLLGLEVDNLTLSDNAYGTDILVQSATVSDEWDLVSSSGGSSGGSSGTDTGGKWTAFTPTWNNFTPDTSLDKGRYRYVGGDMHIDFVVTLAGSWSIAGQVSFDLPDGAQASNTAGCHNIGNLNAKDGVLDITGHLQCSSNATQCYLYANDDNITTGQSWVTGDDWYGSIRVAITKEQTA